MQVDPAGTQLLPGLAIARPTLTQESSAYFRTHVAGHVWSIFAWWTAIPCIMVALVATLAPATADLAKSCEVAITFGATVLATAAVGDKIRRIRNIAKCHNPSFDNSEKALQKAMRANILQQYHHRGKIDSTGGGGGVKSAALTNKRPEEFRVQNKLIANTTDATARGGAASCALGFPAPRYITTALQYALAVCVVGLLGGKTRAVHPLFLDIASTMGLVQPSSQTFFAAWASYCLWNGVLVTALIYWYSVEMMDAHALLVLPGTSAVVPIPIPPLPLPRNKRADTQQQQQLSSGERQIHLLQMRRKQSSAGDAQRPVDGMHDKTFWETMDCLHLFRADNVAHVECENFFSSSMSRQQQKSHPAWYAGIRHKLYLVFGSAKSVVMRTLLLRASMWYCVHWVLQTLLCGVLGYALVMEAIGATTTMKNEQNILAHVFAWILWSGLVYVSSYRGWVENMPPILALFRCK